jgi:hypothetical protein
VILLDDKSVFENYSRGATLSEKEMDALLTSNSGANKWRRANNPADTNGSIQTWKAIDSATKKPSRYAVTNGGSNLSFYVPDILEYCEEAAKSIVNGAAKKKAETIKGF